MANNEPDPRATPNSWASETSEFTGKTLVSAGAPRIIGRYKIVRVLGKGGFGIVFLATDEQLQRSVAIKIPDAHLVSQPGDVQLYLAEARTVAGLDHPHIVPVYDVGSSAEFPCYIVSRFVAGGDLATAMRGSRFLHRECAELVAVIAEALHFAHMRGIVHRDIKPGNILLDARNKPYVTDFGLALQEVNVGRGPGFAGTPAYMSPEQARGEGHRVDGRSDVFSLGVVFYELLTGRRPFRAEKQGELLEQIIMYEPRPPRQLDDTIPRELERICLKALAKRTSERYTTAHDLAEELRQTLTQPSSPPTGSSGSGLPSGASLGAVSPATHPTDKAVSETTPGSGSSSPRAPSSARMGQANSSQVKTATGGRGSQLAKIVPKGLRSFDAKDADFFLDLLPGARDREGLPTAIRFWKTKLETGDPDKTFAVGLLYGPSGCGKSSLVKAGIVPNLARHVLPVYLEATPDSTEPRILAALRKQCPGLPDRDLVETFAALRCGEGVPAGKKIVLFIDQFEQWMHAHRGEEYTPLARALRQCDGARLQCILMVRDDFWMSVTRFMRELEVRLFEGANSAAVDLFSPRHARKVLAAFGHAFGCLAADHEDELTAEQSVFLKQAVAGITESGTVIPVRLALFAEMIKTRPWTTASLQQMGGASGIGAAFLQETFSSSTAPPEHRYHQQAARNVLKSLLSLPGQTANIKGHMRSRDELLQVSGYSSRPREFDDLLRMLDSELRLITPTELEHTDACGPREPTQSELEPLSSSPATEAPILFYQLTHDYLVPSLRDWLTRKQRESRKGRAELRLEERSEVWNLKANPDYLPAWWEVANILLLTERSNWTAPQRRMMRSAFQQQGLRALLGLVVVGLLILGGLEVNGRMRGAALVEQIVNAETVRVPAILKEFSAYRRWGLPLLEQARKTVPARSREELNIGLACLGTNPDQADLLLERALTAEPEEFAVLGDALVDHRERLSDRLWSRLENPAEETKKRLAAGLMLAKFEPGAPPGVRTSTAIPARDRWQENASFLTEQLLDTAVHNTARYDLLLSGLAAVGKELIPVLQGIYHDLKKDVSQRSIAMNIVERFAPDDATILSDVLVTSGDLDRLEKRLPSLKLHTDEAAAFLHAELARVPEQVLRPDWNDPPLDPAWTEPDGDLLRRIEAAQGFVAERFAICQTMPLAEFAAAAEQLRLSGYRPVRARPFQSGPSQAGQGVQIAAVWTRDGVDFRFASGLSADEARQKQAEWKEDEIHPIDLAGYLDGEFRFFLLAARDPDISETVLTLGLSSTEVLADFYTHSKLRHPMMLQISQGAAGEHRTCRVWVTRKSSTFRASQVSLSGVGEKEYESDIKKAVLPLVDASICGAADLKTPRELFTLTLADWEEKVVKQPDIVEARVSRAYFHFLLEHDLQALDDLNVALDKEPQNILARAWRAAVHARLNHIDLARRDVAELDKSNAGPLGKAYYGAIVGAYLGEPVSGFERLEAVVREQGSDVNSIYLASNAYAWGAKALAEKDQPTSSLLADRSVELLREAIAKGVSDYSTIRADPDLEGIYAHPGYQQILGEEQNDRSYIYLTATSPNRVVFESHGLPPAEHLARCSQLAAAGCRPLSIGVCQVGEGKPLATISVWQKPVVAQERRDELAIRQANAATILLRLNEPATVWLLLQQPLSPSQQQPIDPHLRTVLIHQMSRMGADAQALALRLPEEPDSGVRQALILALGEYPANALGVAEQDLLEAQLWPIYRNDPDAGVHSAAEWLLRKRGHAGELATAKDELGSADPPEGRQWYVNRNGQTLAVVPGAVEFQMGSPHYEFQKSYNERQHTRRIERTFAIATTEVKIEQFRRFLAEYPALGNSEHTKDIGELDRPAGWVTWYEAAQYCRWLSESEGIPEDQMCYPPVLQIKSGMQLERVLEKTGYRLPTEAEWEMTCRAGTATAFSFGGSPHLAAQFAWFSDNSGGHPHPVGLLKPNRWGLFDMHGNIDEWCQNSFIDNYPFPIGSQSVPDALPAKGIMAGSDRVIRGSENRNPPVWLRAARRVSCSPAIRDSGNGFRVARTISLATAAEGGN